MVGRKEEPTDRRKERRKEEERKEVGRQGGRTSRAGDSVPENIGEATERLLFHGKHQSARWNQRSEVRRQ